MSVSDDKKLKGFKRVLIANRGEVVVRVAKSLVPLGITPVVMFTEPDRGAYFTTAVSEVTVCIGAAANYLNIEAVVAAAKATQCDAVHPGWGFLSENASFAQAVIDAGMVFIGPQPSNISRLGSKIGAKRILREVAPQVPLIPGFTPTPQEQKSLTVQQWQEKATGQVGFPLLIKAAAGGGGKGMRIVRSAEEFPAAFEAVLVEARAAFGDESILLERYFESVKHIEVQILGDTHGNVAHVFERECSVQRRHQKLLEECPSVAISARKGLRQAICEAAVLVGRSVQYSNAGTVEFIFDPSEGEGKFYFLEVNTRLQVEHCVTEQCADLDLVAAQVYVAQGATLEVALRAAKRFSPLFHSGGQFATFSAKEGPQQYIPDHPVGFAIEARVYAEDDNFAPCTGRISAIHFPLIPGVTYHTAAVPGSDISVNYDGLIVKIVAYSHESRRIAVDKLIHALFSALVFGVKTNRIALINLLAHPAVRDQATMTTDMIDKGVLITHEMLERRPGYELPGGSAVDLAASVDNNSNKKKENSYSYDAELELVRVLAVASHCVDEQEQRESMASSSSSNNNSWSHLLPRWSNSNMTRHRRFIALPGTAAATATAAEQAAAAQPQQFDLAIPPKRLNPNLPQLPIVVSPFSNKNKNSNKQRQKEAQPTGVGGRLKAPTKVFLDVVRLSMDMATCRNDGNAVSNGIPPSVHHFAMKLPTTTTTNNDTTSTLSVECHCIAQVIAGDTSHWPDHRHAVTHTVHIKVLDSGMSYTFGLIDRLGGSLPTTHSADQGDSLPASYGTGGSDGAAAVKSPIPAKVVKVVAKNGASVKKGDVVVVLESMKMERKLMADRDGVVSISVKVGEQLLANQTVFVIKEK